jgi:alcohol dehydrogenase
MLAARGANPVVVIDPDRACCARALRFGATHSLSPHDADFEGRFADIVSARGADIALELAGQSQTVELCLSRVRIGGTVILAGTVSPAPAVALDPQLFVRRHLTLRGVHNYQARHLQAALEFLGGAGQNYPLASLIGETFPLDRAEEAFDAARLQSGRRVAVIPAEIP